MTEKSKSEKPTELRRDAGLTKMLKTPPKPHKEIKKGKPKRPQSENADDEK